VFLDRSEIVIALGSRVLSPDEQLGVTEDHAQGVVHLMGNAGRQLADR